MSAMQKTMQKVMETVVQFVADKKPDPLIQKHDYIGQPLSRVDGPLKVKGEAHFTADYKIDNLVHAMLVHSPIAKGKVTKIHRSEAEKAPGFIAMITHENAPKMQSPTLLNVTNLGKGVGGNDLPILQDCNVHYDGAATAPANAVIGAASDPAPLRPSAAPSPSPARRLRPGAVGSDQCPPARFSSFRSPRSRSISNSTHSLISSRSRV